MFPKAFASRWFKIAASLFSFLLIGVPTVFSVWWYMFFNVPPYVWFRDRGFPAMITNYLWLWLLVVPITVGLILLCLILRRTVQVPQKSAGRLIGEVAHAAFFEGDNERDGIAVALLITNRGDPTIVDRWGLILELDGDEFRYRATHFQKDFTIWDNDGHPVRLEPSEMLYEKVGTTPIPKGGRVPGYLVFLTKGISYERLITARSRFKVIFSDAFGNDYVAETNAAPTTSTILYQPGLNDPFAAVLIRESKHAKSGQTTLEIIDGLINKGEKLAASLAGFETVGSQKLNEPWIKSVQDTLREREPKYLPMFNEARPYTGSYLKNFALTVDAGKWMEDKERRFSWETVMGRLDVLRKIRGQIRSKLPS